MDDKKEKQQDSIEELLMRELRFGGLHKDRLKELVSTVASIQKAGLKRLKVNPKGVPPLVDSLRVTGVIDASEVIRFLGEFLTKTPALSTVEIFPIGIPFPDIFGIKFDLGSPVEPGPINRF
jgi:hypothetical protein